MKRRLETPLNKLYRVPFLKPKKSQIPDFNMLDAFHHRPWWRYTALVWVLLWICLAGAGSAHAQDHIVERGWLEDPTGQLTWTEVQERAMQPFKETLNQGFGRGVLWLRLRIEPNPLQLPSAPLDPLVLRIRPVYLDEVVVFDPLAPGGRVGVVGDRQHPQQDVLQGTDFLMPIARGNVPRDLWLRLQSTSTRQIHVEALPQDTLASTTLRWNVITSFYIGAVMVLLLWGVVNLLLTRDAVMGSFALMNLTAGLFGLTSLGFFRVFWPLAWSAETLNLLGSLFSVLVVGGGVVFHIRFLREFRPVTWAMGLLYAMLALVLVNLALLALGQVTWALQSNMVTILLAPPICLVCAITGRVWVMAPDAIAEPALTRQVLVAFYVSFLTIFMLSSTTGLGWLPASEWTIYVSQLHTLVSSVLLMLMLQYRAFILSKKRQQAQLDLEKSTLQIAHERQMREDQAQLMAMLTHELKTPLATMHMRLDPGAQGTQAIKRAIGDMNRVIERCLQTTQLDDRQLLVNSEHADLVKLILDAVSSCAQPAQVQMQMPAQCFIQTDRQLLFIVLSNLLENACKYAAADSLILLHLKAQEPSPETPGQVRIEISNLPGLAGWPDADKVFDKYYRSPQARRQAGTGLGLFLVHKLMQTLGGHAVYAPDSVHVRFVLQLPISVSAV